MRARSLVLLGLFLVLAAPREAFAFSCGTTPDAKCSCQGSEDCQQMRKSGMCKDSLTCTKNMFFTTCSCTAAKMHGVPGTSRPDVKPDGVPTKRTSPATTVAPAK